MNISCDLTVRSPWLADVPALLGGVPVRSGGVPVGSGGVLVRLGIVGPAGRGDPGEAAGRWLDELPEAVLLDQVVEPA